MLITQGLWQDGAWHQAPDPSFPTDQANLILCFGCCNQAREGLIPLLQKTYPRAILCGCSTAGEIFDTQVEDHSVSVVIIAFEKTRVRATRATLEDTTETSRAARQIASDLKGEELVHVLVLSDGLHVNGTTLTQTLSTALPDNVSVSGGLAGDYGAFEHTCAWLDRPVDTPGLVAIGFYGSHLKVGHGSLGGWDPFGPVRLVTRAEGNVLYELDGQSALELYTRYLGDKYARDLPGSALLFPLTILDDREKDLVRTVLSVDPVQQMMTFAGDIPEGSRVRFMKANFDRLIEGASGAAEQSRRHLSAADTQFALLVSCVGRKMVLKQRVEEETEAVRDILPKPIVLSGFYSYGEISPLVHQVGCTLHNQTMTITTFGEVSDA